ncbi:KTSC domain-containing protein [Kosakonia arachidis]|uniref:KTSC domain-containing protein n=1 Tax=Kosakonia arachidis TaxID=551989 RepID=A0A1I7A223_9ENTR|nr:KTSC domain-containing protein [Kosakonia arachidis]SFT68975.1 KTSC domain-containing protein [Kosakonia arachidis]
MRHHPVTSSRISSIGYDSRDHTLEICFHDKSIYQYQNVPERIFTVFLSVVSKGRFYDGVVKGKFPEKKVA